MADGTGQDRRPTSGIAERPGVARIAVRLHTGAERAVRSGHPWVFAEGISRQRQEGRAGDLAVIFDRENRFLAIGLYDPDSPIRIRVLHRGSPRPIDQAWLVERIAAAYQVRRESIAADTTAFRVIHGENDGLPGLVVDRYAGSIVVKLYTSAWLPHLDGVIAALRTACAPERVVLRLSRALQRREESEPSPRAGERGTEPLHVAERGTEPLHVGERGTDPVRDGQLLVGDPLAGAVLFLENGLTFEADLVRGQKTGFFLDQRDNRARVERRSAGKRVLNVFSYTGGFSVYAARGGARSVTSLDASAPALAAAERNFEHNRSDPAVAAAGHRILARDAFAALREMRSAGEQYDLVVLDPPSFAKAKSEVERALGSYARVIGLGTDVLAKGGVLVAASCSSRIGAEDFRAVVEASVTAAGRSLTVEEQTAHPVDHPIGFPEGAYLKCVFAAVA